MIVVSSIGEILEQDVSRLAEYRSRLTASFQQVGNEVRERIQNEQLSGRDSSDMGLNIITGRAHDSLRTYTTADAYETATLIRNLEEAYYLRYPEDGAGHNPKRLNIEEGEIRDYAQARYEEEAVHALSLLAAA